MFVPVISITAFDTDYLKCEDTNYFFILRVLFPEFKLQIIS